MIDEVRRNPLLALPAARRLQSLPIEQRQVIASLLREIAVDANERAESAWRRRKGPMAAYWRATSTYAKHAARAIARRPADVDDGPCPICDHVDGHHDDYAHAAAAVTG